jgi:hypothetical protein
MAERSSLSVVLLSPLAIVITVNAVCNFQNATQIPTGRYIFELATIHTLLPMKHIWQPQHPKPVPKCIAVILPLMFTIAANIIQLVRCLFNVHDFSANLGFLHVCGFRITFTNRQHTDSHQRYNKRTNSTKPQTKNRPHCKTLSKYP